MTTKQIPIMLGTGTVCLNISSWGNSKVVHINLHENEQTSVAAGREILSKKGGVLIELRSQGERLITFNSNNSTYIFDPNRIFSSHGIKDTLTEHSSYDPVIHSEIAGLADTIIRTIYSFDPAVIIALHNTTGDYCMNNYIKGGKLESDMADLFINPERNNAYLFFTTDREAFEAIKTGAYNVVLQDNEAVTDDGSLSVYCAMNGLKYINIEALHGHKEEQMQMISFINSKY